MKEERVPFKNIFKVYNDGSIENIVPIRINGITAEAFAIRHPNGAFIGGIDWSLFTEKDLSISKDGKYSVIKGIFLEKE